MKEIMNERYWVLKKIAEAERDEFEDLDGEKEVVP